MNMKPYNNTNPDDELYRLIDRYFEGETSLDEERRLRRLLAGSTRRDATLDEARAVMGLFAAARSASTVQAPVQKPARRRRRQPLLVAVSVAASVAVIIGAALSLTHISIDGMPSGETMSIASASGMRPGNHDSIAQLMLEDNPGMAGGRHSVATVQGSVKNPDSPDDVAALISSEMGYMAEAQRTMYESIEDDFVSLSAIIN